MLAWSLVCLLTLLNIRQWMVNRDLAFQVFMWNMIADKRMTDEEREEMEEDIKESL